MTASQSGVFSLQEFADTGILLVGGRLYTYVAGTTTFKTAYTDAASTIPQTYTSDGQGGQYIALNARGELPAPLYLTTGSYDITLKRADGTTVWTRQADPVADTVSGIIASFTAFVASLAASAGSFLIGFIQAGTGAVARTVQAELRDTVKPQQFGAIGNGVADDTAAFIAALATGKDVFVPNGTYKITSTLTMSTTQQQLLGAGRLSVLQFVMASATPAIIFSGSSGRQRVTGLTITASNCPKMFSFQSAQVQVLYNWLTNTTTAGIVCYLENENTGASLYSFGALIGYNFIHGSLTTGSRGIRLGLNSQTTQIFGNTIDFFETAIAVENATDSLVIEGNILEMLMPTGYGVDMRGTAGSPTYHAISIRKNHFEDVYGAIAWGGTGGTYTSNVYENNYFSGRAGGTNYFLTVSATVGAGSANNRVAYNDVSGNLTSFFNLGDQAGAASLVDTKGNTLGAGTFATGTYASYAYQIREVNAYFGSVIASGAYDSQTVPRQAASTGVFRVFLRWDPHEYLESIQFKYLPVGSTPSITVALHQVTVDTDTVLATTGAVTAAGIVTLTVNASAQPSFHYYLEVTCALGGGATAYFYPFQMFLRA